MTTRLLALRRSRADLGSVAAIGATVLVVCALVSGLVGALPELQRRALAAALEALPADQRVVAVSATYSSDDLPGQDAAVQQALDPVLSVAGGALVRSVSTAAHPVVDGRGTWSFGTVETPTGAKAVDVVDGRLPATDASRAVEVAAPAGSPGAEPGREWTVRSPVDGRPVRVRVVGTWRPAARAADLVPDGGAGVLLVAVEDLERLAGSGTTVRWLATPDPATFRPGDLDGLTDAAAGLEVAVAEAAERTGRTLGLENPLPRTADELAARLGTQRTLLLVPVLMLALVGGATATLAAATLGHRRRTDEELLRARGAARLAQVGPSAWEALVVCVLAAVGGMALGRLVPRALGVGDRLTATAVAATAVAGALCWLMLSVPTLLRAVGPDRGEEAGPEKVRRRRVTRLVAAALLVVAAGALGLLSLSRVRVAAETGRADAMGVAASSLVLAAMVALLVGVLLPLLFRATTTLLRSRGPVLQVAARAVSRQLGETLPIAFVTALVAGGVAFAVVEDRTRDQTLADRALHEVGADVRVLAPLDAVRAGADAERDQLAAVGQVTSIGAVHRELRFVDDVAVELVAADLQEEALASLVSAAADPGALAARPSDDVVAAAVSPGLAEEAGLVPGTRFELPVDGVRTAFEVVTIVPAPPTVDPRRETVLLDRAALGHVVSVDEWWLGVTAGGAPRVATELAGRPELAREVQTPAGAEAELLASPDTGGVALPRVLTAVAVGTVTLGVVALVAVALLRRAERRRWADFLRALGASRRDVGLTLATEHALVAVGGSLAGAGAGTVTAVLATAASAVTGGTGPVVEVSVGVPWAWLLAVTALLVAVPLLALRLAAGGSGEGR
ncbi:MAG TPA: FtsX-like permease family protein [Nocardioides sp.]|nr:FtsX-like permease family protein [Nocardioides sp.]